jgi:hypothetical protein
MRRREFTTFLGGAAVAWPLAARAQQPERMRRIGVLLSGAADDPDVQVRLAAFEQGLQQLGWTDGRNARIEYHWDFGDSANTRKYAGNWPRSRRTVVPLLMRASCSHQPTLFDLIGARGQHRRDCPPIGRAAAVNRWGGACYI